jgi:hypothetical protein
MELDFKPNVGLVSSTRRFVAELFSSMLVDPDATSRLALTVHELLENMVKYSTDGNGKLEVGVEDAPSGHMLQITASNRTTPERVKDLRRRISDLSELTDPMETYVRMMRESVARGDGSELGLARIRVEGEMALGFSADGDRITITACTPVALVEAP